MPNIISKISKRQTIIILLIVFAAFYFVFDPMEWGFMPQCVFHRVTGLQCAGCGSQRMLHALLHGDIAGAFRANAFAVVSIPAIIFLAWVELNRRKRPVIYKKVYSPPLIIIVGILLIAWTIVRNLSNL